MIEKSINQEDITTLNMSVPNNRFLKMDETKTKRNRRSKIMFENFNTLLLVIDKVIQIRPKNSIRK